MHDIIRGVLVKYSALILGENKFAPLRKRMFVLILWSSILIALIGNIINIIYGFPPILIAFTSMVILGLSFIYYRIRTTRNVDYEKYVYLNWILIILAIPMIWIFNSGIDGNTIILIFVVFVGMFLTFNPKYRFKILLFFIILITLLLLLDFFYPHFIVRYSKIEQRIADLVLGYALYISLIYALLNLLVKNTEFEQAKLNIRNQQLSLLTEKTDELNEQLKITIQELKQANYSKDRFISIIAHDLRSPYQGLLGVSKILLNEYDNLNDIEKKGLLAKLNILMEKQYEFLDDLLLWGRIQRNSISVVKEETDILEILKSVKSIFDEAIAKKRITVNINSCDNPIIITDRNLLSTVIRNVFSNSLKFSVIGGTVDVDIQKQTMFRITITDFGIGINESDLNKIFKVEENISRKGTDGELGTGLGLIVCYEIMKKLNGSITIKSKEGSGTVVTLEL